MDLTSDQKQELPMVQLKRPLDHHSDALLTVLARYVLGRFLKQTLFHAPLHILDFVHF